MFIPRGTTGNSWWRFAAAFFKSRPYLRPKNLIFHTRFQKTSKIHTRFQTWPLCRNYVIITYIRAQTKKFFKSISNLHIFLSDSCGIETMNTFIHSRSSLKNHTRFQTKMGEVYTPLQTRLFTVLYFSVRSSRSRALRYGPCMSVKTT